MLGKPVIKGTRIPVELIIRKLGEGATLEDVLDAYPNLKKKIFKLPCYMPLSTWVMKRLSI